jgi:hypothetical protein
MWTVSILSDTPFLLAPDVIAQNHGARYCFSTGEPRRLGRGTDAPNRLEIGPLLLIDVVGYSKLVREEKQP